MPYNQASQLGLHCVQEISSLKKLEFRELDVSPGKTETRQICRIYIPGEDFLEKFINQKP